MRAEACARSDALVATAFHYLSLVAIESEDDENLGEGPAPIRRSPSPRVEDLPARAFESTCETQCERMCFFTSVESHQPLWRTLICLPLKVDRERRTSPALPAQLYI